MLIYLKTLILSQYHSQRAFAKACGRYDDWISRIIQGARQPSKQEKELICAKLGIKNEDYLFVDWGK